MRSFIRVVAAAISILSLGACQRAAEPVAHPDPDGAVARFERGLARLGNSAEGPADTQAVMAEALAGLFTEPACSKAWEGWSRTAPEQRAAEVFEACRRAYCPKLPAPKPRACALAGQAQPSQVALWWPELAWAALARDLGRDRAARVLGGLMILQPVGEAPIEIDLPRAAVRAPEAPTQVRVFCEPDATRVELGQQSWRLPGRLSGRDLQPLIEALGARRDQAQVVLYASPELAYERVVDAMDALKAAGLARLAVAVPKAP